MDSSQLFLYHSTAAAKLPAILNNGVVPPEETYREPMETRLVEFAEDRGISIPLDRTECSFFHPTLEQATEHTMFYGTDDEDEELFGPEGIAVVDGQEISGRVAVGEFRLFGEVVHFSYTDVYDEYSLVESYEEAAEGYAESFVALDEFTSLDEIVSEYDCPEIMVEGGVSAESVSEALFMKEIRQKCLGA